MKCETHWHTVISKWTWKSSRKRSSAIYRRWNAKCAPWMPGATRPRFPETHSSQCRRSYPNLLRRSGRPGRDSKSQTIAARPLPASMPLAALVLPCTSYRRSHPKPIAVETTAPTGTMTVQLTLQIETVYTPVGIGIGVVGSREQQPVLPVRIRSIAYRSDLKVKRMSRGKHLSIFEQP